MHRRGRLEDRDLAARQLGILGEHRAQRARRFQLGEKDSAALFLAQRPIVVDHTCITQQLADDGLVDVGILAQVDACQVEPEGARGVAQLAQAPISQQRASPGAKARVDHVEVALVRARVGVRPGLAHRGTVLELEPERRCGGVEARVDAGERAPIRLVLAMQRAVRRLLRQRIQLRRDLGEQSRQRKLGAQRVHLREVVVEDDLALAAERHLEHLGIHEGVAIAIAAHPASHRDQRRQPRPAPLSRQGGDRVFDVGHEARHRVDEGVVEVGERVLDLVAHAELHGAQHARLPEGRDEPAQFRGRRLEVAGQRIGRIHAPQPLGDGELAVERALPLHLGGMRGQHRVDADRAQVRRRLVARGAALARFHEKPADGGRQRRRAVAPVVAVAPDVVAVLGDVGQQREIAEGAHHRHRLLGAEAIERRRKELTRGAVFEAPARHGKLADLLDQLERGVALVGADGVAEEPAEEADVLAQPGVLVVAIVHRDDTSPAGASRHSRAAPSPARATH